MNLLALCVIIFIASPQAKSSATQQSGIHRGEHVDKNEKKCEVNGTESMRGVRESHSAQN